VQQPAAAAVGLSKLFPAGVCGENMSVTSEKKSFV
jgi:hypothetical protein